jgi:hypothetical protein
MMLSADQNQSGVRTTARSAVVSADNGDARRDGNFMVDTDLRYFLLQDCND